MAFWLLALTLIQVISLFLPFTSHVKFNEVEEHIPTTYTNIYETPFVWIFAGNFLTVALAAISFNKLLAIIINAMTIVWSALLLLFFQYMFVWDGQAIHARFGDGYWLHIASLFTLIIFSFVWETSYKASLPSRSYIIVLTIATILVPLSMIVGMCMAINASANEPIMRSEDHSETDTKYLRQESWDYTNAYDAYVTKYYSKNKSSNPGVKHKTQLDSVKVTFFDEHSNIIKQIKRPAINGTIDIESLLESQQP